MRILRSCLPCALLALPPLVALASFPAFSSPPAPPRAGPGGVITALQSFVRALDTGNRDALTDFMAAKAPGLEMAFEGDDAEMREKAGPVVSFFDVAANGDSIAARSRDDAVRTLLAEVGGTDARRVQTKIIGIHADCPSADCSYGVVAFERHYDAGGANGKTTVPMRATALVRYDEAAKHFRIFHWHASRAADAVAASAAAAKGAK